MKNTSVSLFRQVLDLIPKREFEEIVMKHNGDKRSCRPRAIPEQDASCR